MVKLKQGLSKKKTSTLHRIFFTTSLLRWQLFQLQVTTQENPSRQRREQQPDNEDITGDRHGFPDNYKASFVTNCSYRHGLVLSANICKPPHCAPVLIKISQVLTGTHAWQIAKNPKHSFNLADPHYWLERSLQKELVWECRYCQVSKKPMNWQISRLSFVPFLRAALFPIKTLITSVS